MKIDTMPLNKKIEDYLVSYIKERNLKAGDRIPPLRDIGKKFSASQFPVQRATNSLVNRGILERIPGKGTIVKQDQGPAQTSTNKFGALYWPKDFSFFKSPFYSGLLAGIATATEAEDKSLLLHSLRQSDTEDPNETLRKMAGEVDGFIMAAITLPLYETVRLVLKELAKPVVFIMFPEAADGFDTVLLDNRNDSRQMLQLLTDAGHRDIACLYSSSRIENITANIQERVDTYYQYMQEQGVTVSEDRVYCSTDRTFLDIDSYSHNVHIEDTEFFTWFKKTMASGSAPTAFFCTNDGLAFMVYAACQKLGLKVPDDLTVVGSGNIEAGSKVTPPLTTVNLEFEKIGIAAVRRLEEMMEEQSQGIGSHKKALVKGSLVKRESVKTL
jgi:DNA-binding LacI/PurR family transcriptional regulator